MNCGKVFCGHHPVEVSDELLRPALVGDVEVVSRIVVIQVWLTVGVVFAHDGQTRQCHEEGLADTACTGVVTSPRLTSGWVMWKLSGLS